MSLDKGNLSRLRHRATCNFAEIEDGILVGTGRTGYKVTFTIAPTECKWEQRQKD